MSSVQTREKLLASTCSQRFSDVHHFGNGFIIHSHVSDLLLCNANWQDLKGTRKENNGTYNMVIAVSVFVFLSTSLTRIFHRIILSAILRAKIGVVGGWSPPCHY